MTDIPKKESWLWENKEALGAVEEGLADIDEGRIHDIDKEIQMDISAEISKLDTLSIERSFQQAERGELEDIPLKYITPCEDAEGVLPNGR